MIADTKISDTNGTLRRATDQPHAHNYVPGRLKAFPLNLQFSVAYAGLSGKALSILRSVRREMSGAASDLDRTIARLRAGSEDGAIDFLLMSHIAGPEIYKIANGTLTFGQPFQWIGDGTVAPLLSASVEKARIARESVAPSNYSMHLGPEYGAVEEHDFRRAWIDLLLAAPTLNGSVGGIPIAILGSPYGHDFLNSAGAYNPETITVSWKRTFDEEGQQIDPLRSQYSYSLVGSSMRGAPVLGLWLKEADSAYVYDPMDHDEAQRIRPVTMEQLSATVARRAKELGGVIIDR
jgi:hypothetical protein